MTTLHNRCIVALRNSNRQEVEAVRASAGTTPIREFHVIRDPRDVLVSAYFSHKTSHPTAIWPALEAQRRCLTSLSVEDGLLATLDFIGPVFEDMMSWADAPSDVLEVRFDELVTNPLDSFVRVFAHLGLLRDDVASVRRLVPETLTAAATMMAHRIGAGRFVMHLGKLSVPLLAYCVDCYRFSRLAKGRLPGSEDLSSHFRKGVTGDWVNHFTPRVAKEFHTRWQRLLKGLGYEPDAGWVDRRLAASQ
jgi:hypothetical protein